MVMWLCFLGTVNLDGRYYTETESDTLYTKKLGQEVIGVHQIDGRITNKSVSFGGVSVNLGSSDSTKFQLSGVLVLLLILVELLLIHN